jgi:hypothetical protein
MARSLAHGGEMETFAGALILLSWSAYPWMDAHLEFSFFFFTVCLRENFRVHVS